MIKIYVNVIPTAMGNKLFKSKIYKNDKELIAEFSTHESLKKLLLDIKLAIKMFGWKNYEIVSHFNTDDLTEEEQNVWGIPLSELQNDEEIEKIGMSNRFQQEANHVISLYHEEKESTNLFIRFLKNRKIN